MREFHIVDYCGTGINRILFSNLKSLKTSIHRILSVRYSRQLPIQSTPGSGSPPLYIQRKEIPFSVCVQRCPDPAIRKPKIFACPFNHTGMVIHMSIHPTAVVDPSAKIHESVEIGPHSIIEKNVEIGENTIIESCVRICSGSRIGKGNHIFHNAVLGTLPQNLGFDLSLETELHVGDENIIREGVTISRSTRTDAPTIIGNRNYIMGNFHMGHDSRMGDNNVLAQGSIVAGHVEMGSRIFISGVVAIHQFCRIGDYSMIAGLSRVVKDVPPYSIVEGNPAALTGLNMVGLKRAGLSFETQNAVREAYELLFLSNRSIKSAIEEIRSENKTTPEVELLLKFLETNERGIVDRR